MVHVARMQKVDVGKRLVLYRHQFGIARSKAGANVVIEIIPNAPGFSAPIGDVPDLLEGGVLFLPDNSQGIAFSRPRYMLDPLPSRRCDGMLLTRPRIEYDQPDQETLGVVLFHRGSYKLPVGRPGWHTTPGKALRVPIGKDGPFSVGIRIGDPQFVGGAFAVGPEGCEARAILRNAHRARKGFRELARRSTGHRQQIKMTVGRLLARVVHI